jgi:hypothetical protein
MVFGPSRSSIFIAGVAIAGATRGGDSGCAGFIPGIRGWLKFSAKAMRLHAELMAFSLASDVRSSS